MCRQFYRAANLKRSSVWIIILLSLSFPSLVCSQPLNHSKLSLLSPIQRAEILLKRSLNEEALLLYQSLVLKDGANGYAFRGLVRAYKRMGRLDDAESWVEKYLIEKSFTSAALYASGYIFYLKEDVKKAEELFKKALELDDANALALNNLGAVRLSEKSYTQAVKLVRKAIQINPKEPMFFMNLETIYKQMGDPSLIIIDYNFYLKEKKDLDLIRGYGLAVGRNKRQASFRLYNKGYLEKTILKWVEIEKIYKEIDHQSGLVSVYFSLGILYEEKGEFQNAKNYFDLVLKLNPLHIQAKERLYNIR